MKMDFKPLSELAEINPPLGVSLADSDEVSFVPMAAFSEVSASVSDEESREYGAVKKGFTAFRNGDVIFAKITPCFENGKIGLAELSHVVGFGSTEFHVIRAMAGKADSRFLHHFLRQQAVRSAGTKRMTGSAGQRRVPRAFLETLPVPALPLDEQRQIAALLDKAEELRAKRRAAIVLLDQLPQAIFLEMFGDPATNPKGWPLTTMGAVADVQGGLQVSSARKSLPIEIPYLRVANVYRGYLNLSEIKQIRATESEIARTTLKADDLLIVEGHGNAAEIGRGALWDGSIVPCIHQNHLIRVRFNPTTVVPLYASAYINSIAGRRHLLRAGNTTSGLNTISVSDVRGTPILQPPIGVQQQFAARVKSIHSSKAAQQSALVKLDGLFTSLQAIAFGASS